MCSSVRLNLGTEQFLDGLGKWLTDIPTIGQEALNGLQISRAATEGQQGSFTVCYLSCRDSNRMRQALGIDRNVALDSRYFLAGVVAVASRTIA